jgi:ABC-2 type transport system permease protein
MTAPRRTWPLVAAGNAARQALAERGGLVFAAFFTVTVTTVLSSLWRLAANTNGGAIVGYSAAALTWYVAATEACTVSVKARLIAEIGHDVASGAVAVELLRPVASVAVRVAHEVGSVLPRLAICIAAGGVVASIAVGAPPRPAAVALAVPSAVLAVTANLLALHAFAAAAFWLRDAGSTWFLYHKLVFVLGGMLLPLQVLPDGVRRVATLLPFAAMAYVPGRLASGHLEPRLLLLQALWVVVLGAAAGKAFAAGERRLQVVGG